MKRLLAVAALTLPLLSACGEKGETPHIRVDEKARIEKPAELFRFEAKILERNKNRTESLAAASAKLDEIRNKLGRLKELESLKLTANDVKITSIRPVGCDPDDDIYDATKFPTSCEALEYLASIKISVEGGPVSVAGAAIAVVTELNAETTEELRYKVKDPEAAQNEARQAALEKAMRAARALAEKVNAQVSMPLEIKYSNPNYNTDTIIVTGSFIRSREPKIVPVISLDLPADTVTFNAEVSAVFALEKPKTVK